MIENPLYQKLKDAPPVKCNHCFQLFNKASDKFKHQRDIHGDMEGWEE